MSALEMIFNPLNEQPRTPGAPVCHSVFGRKPNLDRIDKEKKRWERNYSFWSEFEVEHHDDSSKYLPLCQNLIPKDDPERSVKASHQKLSPMHFVSCAGARYIFAGNEKGEVRLALLLSLWFVANVNTSANSPRVSRL